MSEPEDPPAANSPHPLRGLRRACRDGEAGSAAPCDDCPLPHLCLASETPDIAEPRRLDEAA